MSRGRNHGQAQNNNNQRRQHNQNRDNYPPNSFQQIRHNPPPNPFQQNNNNRRSQRSQNRDNPPSPFSQDNPFQQNNNNQRNQAGRNKNNPPNPFSQDNPFQQNIPTHHNASHHDVRAQRTGPSPKRHDWGQSPSFSYPPGPNSNHSYGQNALNASPNIAPATLPTCHCDPRHKSALHDALSKVLSLEQQWANVVNTLQSLQPDQNGMGWEPTGPSPHIPVRAAEPVPERDEDEMDWEYTDVYLGDGANQHWTVF